MYEDKMLNLFQLLAPRSGCYTHSIQTTMKRKVPLCLKSNNDFQVQFAV
jgi:hypothetical protein